MKRILAFALAAVLLFGSIMMDAGAYAVDLIYELDDKKKETEEVDYESTLEQYLTLEFETEEDKLATMKLMLEKDGYQLWVDELTGEVATKNIASGQILFSNPYDVGATYPSNKGPSDSTKKKLLSQIMIKYTDNDTEKEMWSFEEASMRGQITIKNIKNGVRVEYSIGREETRMLVPKLIRKEKFEELILDVFAKEINEISAAEGKPTIDWRDYDAILMRTKRISETGNSLWFDFNKFQAYYQEKSADKCTTTREKTSLYAAYPICRKFDVYVFATDATQTEMIRVENYIKTYVPSFTYETLESVHAETEYEGSDKNPPLFKLSLEYTLDEWGMSVRMPANGLRFNESLYQLNYVSILPYMGAAANYLQGDSSETFTGYNFFPDGSGTIFRHEDLAGASTTTINAKVYGFDFAYNEITGNHTETVRYPVFGIVSNTHNYVEETETVVVEEAVVDPKTGEVLSEAVTEEVTTEVKVEESKGFLAIIEEGDALAELSTYHAGSLSKYNTVNMLFYPRPKDSYNLANAISVGANASWTVVSQRKYVGNYKIRYIMLTDQDIAAEKGLDQDSSYKNYEVTWMGMANAYRDYLYDKGELEALTEEDVDEDIPVYIETFGAVETVEKILSVPVNVMTPLTSFENVKTMYDELSSEGVSNIKFKLTGYANGGMFAGIPYRLKWEKAVGGASGYEDLVADATENGYEVFPDFDFAYVSASTNELFDGLTFKNHIVKSINDTYMSKRYYSATKQTMLGRYELAVSAAYYAHFYEKLNENLLAYYKDGQKKTISVASLGSALNSDFDEDEPYNREDTKKQTVSALAAIDEAYDDVMTESANAYTWSYVDYIINVPLDSSRYNKSSAAVPFIGVVLHGSKQFSGSALNMEGNIGYSLMKAIENGAGIYFILCYQNYAELKESQVLSQYYSVRYDILKTDVVKYYTLINDLTKDLQLEKITSHEFLIGERVPDEDEVIADQEAAEKAIQEAADELAAAEKKAETESLLNGRVYSKDTCTTNLEKIQLYYDTAIGYEKGNYTISDSGYVTVTVGMQTLIDTAQKLSGENGTRTLAAKDLEEKSAVNTLKTAMQNAWAEIYDPFNTFITTGDNTAYNTLVEAYDKAVATAEKQQTTTDTRLSEMNDTIEKTIVSKIESITTLLSTYEKAKTALEGISADDKKAYEDARAAVITAVNTLVTALNTANKDGVLDEAIAECKTVAADADSFSAEFKALYTTVTNALKKIDTSDAKTAATKANSEMNTAAGNLTKVETKYTDFDTAEENVLAYAGSVENAQKYSDLVSKRKLANINVTTFKSDYATNEEYVALKKALDDAKAAYEAAAKTDAETVAKYEAINQDSTGASAADKKTAADYAEAKAKLDELDAAISEKKSYYEQIISTATSARTGKTTEGTSEYTMLTELIEKTEKELNELLNNETEEHKAAQAAVDAFTPTSADLLAKMNAAQAALDKWVEDFQNNYETNPTYVAYVNELNNIDAQIETLTAYFRTISPVTAAVNAYAEASMAKINATKGQNTVLNTMYTDAEYIKLKDAYDEANGKALAILADLKANMENDSEYKTLLETLNTTKAELEKYTLAYTEEDDYKELQAELDEATAALDKIRYAYKETDEYKKLVAAAETAQAAYEKAVAEITSVASGTKKDLTDAYINSIDEIITKKSDADAALAEVVTEAETAVVKTSEYKAALNAQKIAENAVNDYITAFVADLDAQYEEAKEMSAEDKPEETVGMKYHNASEAYTKAQTAYDYFTGAKAIPSTVTDVKSYVTLCSENTTYTTAKDAASTANKALAAYISEYQTKVKAEADYTKASDDLTAATAAVTAATTTLRNVDSTLYSKVSAYYTALNTLVSNENSVETAKKATETSKFKADYDEDYKIFDVINQRYLKAVDEADTALSEYNTANALMGTLNSELEAATKNIKLQINRVTSNVKQQNVAVSYVITADEDAEYAYNYFKDNADYSADLKADMKEQYEAVKALAAQVKTLSADTLVSAKKALETVKNAGYLEDTVNAALELIVDPYTTEIDVEEDDTTEEEEEEEEEDAYEYTKYTDDSGNIVVVGYENGVCFILNYNYFDVTTVYNETTYTLPAYGGIRVNADGTTVTFTTSITD